jgi:hypothetical protein
MKKIYFTILSFGLTLASFGQVTLTKAANEPIIGDVEMYQYFDTVAVLNNSTGANQNWNFSALTSNTLTEMTTYTTVASTPNGSSFSSATIAGDDGQGGYTYGKSTTSQYELVGIVDPNITLNFTNTAIAAIWPISYGYTNTDPFSGSVASGTMTGTSNGTMTTVASGTGTITLPGGAVYNALQVKTTQKVNISLVFGLITATVVNTSYSYYASSQKFPILTVSYSNASGAFTSNTGDVKINSNVVTGINNLNTENYFSMYPNPSKNDFNIMLQNNNKANCKLEIMNSVGALVKSIDLGNDSEIYSNISISNLSSGMYFVKTTVGDKTSTRKLIVE